MLVWYGALDAHVHPRCARMGRFSSGRAIREYAEEIWSVQPVPITI
jgi:hypothetical protein